MDNVEFGNKNLSVDNPWSKMFVDGKFVLSQEEEEAIGKFNIAKAEEYRLQTDIPPQPYQGTPNANIWVLLGNPCFDETEKAFYRHENGKKFCIDQLVFQEKSKDCFANYVLDQDFNNRYAKDWFLSRFVGKDKLLSSENEKEMIENNRFSVEGHKVLHEIDMRFFLLQIHGYASKAFHESACFPHMAYNKALLQWGINAGKVIVIARCISYWKKVIESMDHDDTKIFVLLNNRNSHFTSNNLVRYAEWKQSQLILTTAKSKVEQDLKFALV